MLLCLGQNAYLLELPPDVQISPIFNLQDLIACPGDDASPVEDSRTATLPRSCKPREAIEAILDDQIVSTRRGGYQKFLVKWKKWPLLD